jgi:hypothetical protein
VRGEHRGEREGRGSHEDWERGRGGGIIRAKGFNKSNRKVKLQVQTTCDRYRFVIQLHEKGKTSDPNYL